MSIKLPDLEKLTDHEFIRSILDDSIPLMKPGKPIEEYELSGKEKYKNEAGYYAGQVMNQISRIDQSALLLNSYPKPKAWTRRYGAFEYIQYHMESYVISLSGLTDRLLLLTNHLYILGINDRDVRYSNVVKKLRENGHIDAVQKLEIVKRATKDIKISKNRYTHLVRFWEKELWRIGLIEFSLRNKTVNDEDGFLKQDLEFNLKLYRKKKTDLIAKNETALLEIISDLFSTLGVQYKSQRS